MTTIKPEASANLPTRFGDFHLTVFSEPDGIEHMALVRGDIRDGCLVRVHSECATGDIMGSLRCDCRDQLEMSLNKINEAGSGLCIYLRGQEGRGIGLANKIKAYALQEKGYDTVDANIQLGFADDQRSYHAALAILKHFGLSEIRLLSNNQKKLQALQQGHIKIIERVPLWTTENPNNADYIATKRNRMGHL